MSGIKDKKIVIYKSKSVRNDKGQPITKWFPIHPGSLWAYTRQLSAKEYFAAAAVNYQETIFFTINWRGDITTTMQILYKGNWYAITRIDTFEGYKSDLKVYVKTTTAPNAADILPYEG